MALNFVGTYDMMANPSFAIPPYLDPCMAGFGTFGTTREDKKIWHIYGLVQPTTSRKELKAYGTHKLSLTVSVIARQ
jgi:hypothetical protein